ncbi:hypothetical protein L7F22_008753 [Adiantum nelumboides]|nr:hypothetical protein [Adiantum nelumboides]
MRRDMKKEMYKVLASYKANIEEKLLHETRAEFYNNMKNELQWYVGAEVKISEGVMHKKVDDALVTFETWKSKVEESIKKKDALIEDLKKQLASFKENLDTNEASIKSSAQPHLQEEVKELKTNVENGLRAWSDVIKQHEENMKWIDVAKKQKPSTTPFALSIINDTLEKEKRRKVRVVNLWAVGAHTRARLRSHALISRIFSTRVLPVVPGQSPGSTCLDLTQESNYNLHL